jgi:DNA-nicking Smr family endonuclease
MSTKQNIIRGKIEHLGEVVQKAGIRLKSPEEEARLSRQASPKPETRTQAEPNEEISFLEAMDGVERISWNRKESVLPNPVPPSGEDLQMQQERLMRDAMDENVPIPLPEHPEYVEGWIGLSGKRYLPNLRNGLYSIQGQIDLHGMNREEAQSAVESFIVQMSRSRPCCVKIIHGRGINSPQGSVTLKDNLPKLLATRKLSRYVVAYASSSQCDGGVGSLYVLITPRKA